ncbi:MAG: MotA/TolQ/ExbB proton channel family protein [Kiritimatiellales bacterium]|nr:MotA/TolQ/ExbB proton channel family protein [Kiritimatiellota bacterium]MBL7011968.1 MotA/TolQ/ExbB proton channel family protein [Kiritimatiellales bacterium]
MKTRNYFVLFLLLAGMLCAQAQTAAASGSYTVHSGDTLMGIARKLYGESAGWRAIYAANKQFIKKSGGLQAGMVITIPADSTNPDKVTFPDPDPLPAKGSFERADITVQHQLEDSLAELTALRQKIVMEKIPMSRKLSDLEDELSAVRRDYQQTTRLLDSRTLDLTNLRSEIQSREQEKNYLANLLNEYIRNFESRLHIAELHRYESVLEAAKLAPENSNLSDLDVYQAQAALVSTSLERLDAALGGDRFSGTAVGPGGLMKEGTFVLLGPAALFASTDGNVVGTAEQRLGSLEPAVIAFTAAADSKAAQNVVSDSVGQFPLDPTLGNAHKIEATKQTLWEHISKGGLTMVPILGLAAAALLAALFKWIQLSRLRSPSDAQIQMLLTAVAEEDTATAAEVAASIRGPAGEMLSAGIEHIQEPRDLVEEIMYEKILAAKLKLQSFLPFVAISASSAPLLGLLGTVTGIINTFKLITIFGSGDVKTLSGGISEALITTEFGLIVAIPSLLFHAFLSRKARGMLDQMEKAAVSLINQLTKNSVRKKPEAV